MRISELFKAINDELKKNKIQHVQVLLRSRNGRRYMQFVSVDTPAYKEKVKAIADRYCESLDFINETKTTITYLI